MKSHTDIEQSRKLAEILPLESADMYWRSLNLNGHISWSSHIKRLEPPIYDLEHYIPCWSLSALISVLPNTKLCHYNETYFGQYMGRGDEFPTYSTMEYNNSIDACYEMIIKLHERKML